MHSGLKMASTKFLEDMPGIVCDNGTGFVKVSNTQRSNFTLPRVLAATAVGVFLGRNIPYGGNGGSWLRLHRGCVVLETGLPHPSV